MTQVFVNGGASLAGVSVTTVEQGIQQIQAALVAAGWTTLSGSPTSPPVLMRSGFAVDGEYAHIRLDSVVAEQLHFRIDLNGDGATIADTVAASSGGQSPFVSIPALGSTQIWISCNESMAAVTTATAASAFTAAWFGWLNRHNPADKYAWGSCDIRNVNTESSSARPQGRLARRADGTVPLALWNGGNRFVSNPFFSNPAQGNFANQSDNNKLAVGIATRAFVSTETALYSVGYRGHWGPFVASGFRGTVAGKIYQVVDGGNTRRYLSNGITGQLVSEV